MYMKLFKMGYITIPLVGKDPAPNVKGWGDWAQDGIPEEEVERFEKHYPKDKYGIGLVAGPASNNIILVDVDSVDEEIKKLAPPSPLSRFGQRGFVNVMKNSFDISSQTFTRKNRNLLTDPTGKPTEGIEVRGSGLYVAIPWTIHPVTKRPYIWLSEHTIETFNPEYIPPLLESDVEGFHSISDGEINSDGVSLEGIFTHPNMERCPHDSQSRLKKLASGLIAGCTPIDKAIQDLLRYDEEHHKPIGYFRDKSRPDCKADPYSNAAKFYANILSTHNRNRRRKGIELQVPSSIPTIDVKSLITPPEEKKERPNFPELPGLLGIFKAGILHKIRRDQEDLAIGGALALGSVLCAHRFSIGGVLAHTKLYILNIGKTGAGKDAPFKFIKAVLSHPDMRDENLLGFENYSSKAAILETLTKQKVRIDLRDEFKDTFIAIANNKGASGNEISSFLNQHFTDSGWYGGHYTKTDKWVGACFDPSITLLAGIQPQELISNATLSNFSDGFMGRLLTFMAGAKAKHVGRQHNSLKDVVEYTIAEIKRVIPKLEYETMGIITEKENNMELWTPKLTPLSLDKNYAKHRDDMDRYLADQEDKLEDEGKEQERALLTRQNMFIERVTVIIAACSGDRTVTVEHSKLAEKLVSIAQARSLEVMGVSGMSKLELDAERIVTKIKQEGFLTRGAISEITKRNKREMTDLIDTMLERDLIIQKKADKPSKNGKEVLVYHLH